METKAKTEAVQLTMERASLLEDFFPAPLVFRVADTALADPDLPGAEDGDVYKASASYLCTVGPDGVNTTLRKLHTTWQDRGWEGSLRYFKVGGDVTAHDPVDGFVYFVAVRADHASLALSVDSPMYRDPEPNTLFRPLRPS